MDKQNKINQAIELLEEIYALWTYIETGENNEESRMPNSEEELAKSKELLAQVKELNVDDDEILERYNDLKEIVDRVEKIMEDYNQSANGQADDLLNKIYNLWTDVTTENGTEYHSPANEDEVMKSWELLNNVDEIQLDDDDTIERYNAIKDILQTYKAATEEPGEVDQVAWEKLTEIYNSWTDVTTEDGDEYRNPKTKSEIKASRAMLREVKSLRSQHPQVKERINELENVINSIDAGLPDHRGKFIRSFIVSILAVAGFIYLLSLNTYDAPAFDYSKEWYVTTKGGYLTKKSFVDPNEVSKVTDKKYITTGTQLKPLAKLGTYWLQVETPDKQRGFVHYSVLKGSKFVEADEDALVFNQIRSNTKDSIKPGTKATIINRKIIKDGNHFKKRYIQIKLENGKTKWAAEYDFNKLIFKNIPEINQTYYYPTTPDALSKNMIGKKLSEIEKHYGPATSHLQINGKNITYFRHIIEVKGKQHYKGINVTLNNENKAISFKPVGESRTRFYDFIPLIQKIRELEPNKILSSYFYEKEGIHFEWWDNFKEKHWTTKVIGWIVSILVGLLTIFLYFSIPRLIVAPIMQLIAFSRIFGNGMVKFLNFLIYFAATYLFFVVMVLILDQWLIPAIASIIVFIFWWARHRSTILYHRCPDCHTMYGALSEGSTYQGRTRHETWGTYDVYKGTTETSTTRTAHYQRRDKKEVEVHDHYLDHQTCARCGYQWDISRTETSEKYTTHY